MPRFNRFLLILALIALTSGCAVSLRNPRIADLRYDPGRYQHHMVSIDGVVTTSWGVPAMPFRFYKVDDGTGELTVVSDASLRRLPTRGERVRVRGRVDQVAILGGQALGLHLREESIYIKRR